MRDRRLRHLFFWQWPTSNWTTSPDTPANRTSSHKTDSSLHIRTTQFSSMAQDLTFRINNYAIIFNENKSLLLCIQRPPMYVISSKLNQAKFLTNFLQNKFYHSTVLIKVSKLIYLI